MFVFVCENQRSIFVCSTADIYSYFELIKSEEFQLNIGAIKTSEVNANCSVSILNSCLDKHGVAKHYRFMSTDKRVLGDCYRLKGKKWQN